MNKPMQLATGPVYRAVKPIRDPDYLRFIKRLPCVSCLKTWWDDPAHTGGHGLGAKACDRKAIPLCRKCHREFDADPRGFAEAHRLDIPTLVRVFNSFYERKMKQVL